MAVLAPADWQYYPPRDTNMDAPASNPRQRSSPANEHSSNIPTSHHPQQHQHPHQQHPQQPYTFPLQQQPQGGWTPSITAQPFYPAFYQNHQQQSPQHYQAAQLPPQTPYYDPTNAQLWAYQQMLFNQVQQGFAHLSPHMSPQQRPSPSNAAPNDFYAQNQLNFNQFQTPTPPQIHRGNDPQPQSQQQNAQYPTLHPYRRPNNRQGSSEPGDWRTGPHPPYARPDASGSSTSVNSSSSQRQRTNSNQSGNSGHNAPSSNSSSRTRNVSPASVPNSTRPSPSSASTPVSAGPPSLRTPHNRNTSSSSSSSTATSTPRPSPLSPSVSTATTSSSTNSINTASSSSVPRPTRPSPLSQGTFTAAEKRMSRDDSDLAAMRDPSSHLAGSRSAGLKGRLRRALSFNTAQLLREEELVDNASIKASTSGSRPKELNTTVTPGTGGGIRSPDSGLDDAASTATVQTKKKGRAASLFNLRLNASTDNISLSSTVSSASVMIRKLSSMGKLARRNSLAGITSFFKEKDKDGKKKDKRGIGKAEVSEASVSLATAELDRGGSGDWSVDLQGLSPAAKLARQHTLKTNAEAAARAKAKAQQEAQATSETSASASASAATPVNPGGMNGVSSSSPSAVAAGVPAWDRNTATRHGAPSKGAGPLINEDGTRVVVEEEEEEESEDGHYQAPPQIGQSYTPSGWNDDEEWDNTDEQEGSEDATIRTGLERASLDDSNFGYPYQEEPETWGSDISRSTERRKTPAKGILKHADNYDQTRYLADLPTPNRLRSNSYNSHGTSEMGPLARIPSPDPDHIDGLHRHGSHSSGHGQSSSAPLLPHLSFELGTSSRLSVTLEPKDGAETSTIRGTPPEKVTGIFTHSNSSAPALSTITSTTTPPSLTHRSATTPNKRLAFASNLSVYDTFSASVYDRRSEPATWSRLTPALAQRIKEELNSYKMEEMEVHAASRIHTQFFV